MILTIILDEKDSLNYPIIYEFKEQLEKLIIVHDDSNFDKKKVKKMIKGQKNFKDFYSLDYEIKKIQIDEDSFEHLKQCFNLIKKESKDSKKLYLNASGGLASTSIILSNMFMEYGAKVLAYDIHDNGYNLITKDDFKKIEKVKNKDIYTHFLLKGYEIESIGSKIKANKRKKYVLELCKDLTRYQNFARQMQHKNSIEDVKGYEEIKNILYKIKSNPNRNFIQGTVFEEFIYWTLVDNLADQFDDVLFNVLIKIDEDIRHELDLVIIKNNHLHVMECKLKQTIVPGEEYFYKIDNIMDYLDDDGKAMITVIGRDNEDKMKPGEYQKAFSKAIQNKSKYENISIYIEKNFDKNHFISNVKNHFLGK